jgi:hypothetical protein
VIRAILVVGWLGLLLLGATAANGYRLVGEDTARQHLTLALFPTATLLFANLCVLVYVLGTLRLVRRTAAELRLAGDWAREQRRLASAAWVWPAAAALATVLVFVSGFAAYSGAWPRWVHHAGFGAATLVQLGFLLHGGRSLRAGEARLGAFAAAVESAGGR